jgi:hypothetical protein
MFLIRAVAGCVSCAIAPVDAKRHADKERIDAAIGKTFTIKLH